MRDIHNETWTLLINWVFYKIPGPSGDMVSDDPRFWAWIKVSVLYEFPWSRLIINIGRGVLLWILEIFGSMTIRGSWEKMCFRYENKEQVSSFAMNEGRIRATPDSRKIWESHVSMEDLSARGRNQKWGWLNRGFFRVKYRRQIETRDISWILSITQIDLLNGRCEIVSCFPDAADHILSF
jgi:hypothetical protein